MILPTIHAFQESHERESGMPNGSLLSGQAGL